MGDTTRSIADFTAAVHTALALHGLYGRYVAVALLSTDGEIVDMTPFAGEDACVPCAVEWANTVSHSDPRATRAVLLSGSDLSVRQLREDDIRLYQLARDALAGVDLEVLDWIQTDGDQIRSLAFSCDTVTAWEGGVAT
jgi:hypothetical protein